MMTMMGKQHTNATRPISDVNDVARDWQHLGRRLQLCDDPQQQHATTATNNNYYNVLLFAFPPKQSSPVHWISIPSSSSHSCHCFDHPVP